MQRSLVAAVALVLLVFILPSAASAQSIKGNGKIKTEVRQAQGFNKLVVQGHVELFLSQESSENVKIEADENLIELFQTIVNDNVLYVIVPANIKKTLSLNVSVAFKSLEQITLLDEVTLKSTRAVNFDHIDIVCSGASRMEFEFKAASSTVKIIDAGNAFLKGYTENLTIEAHDDAEVNAFDLQSDNCTVIGSGYSVVSVNAKRKLAATITGNSNMYYIGEPSFSQRYHSSAGLITKRGSANSK